MFSPSNIEPAFVLWPFLLAAKLSGPRKVVVAIVKVVSTLIIGLEVWTKLFLI